MIIISATESKNMIVKIFVRFFLSNFFSYLFSFKIVIIIYSSQKLCIDQRYSSKHCRFLLLLIFCAIIIIFLQFSLTKKQKKINIFNTNNYLIISLHFLNNNINRIICIISLTRYIISVF